MRKSILFIIPICMISGSAVADDFSTGYYGSAKYLLTEQRASEQDTSGRPGVGQFVSAKNKEHLNGGSLAAGYQFGNGWRTEGEYVFRQKAEYTSGSTAFPSSFNHLQTKTERLMLNAYRDFALGYNISLYGTAGLGVSKIKAGGWQGVPTREYASSTQNNLTYSLGAGITYTPVEQVSIDLGYRYVDMGKIESGYNNFANVRTLKDEKMNAHLVSSEFTFGVRYLF